MFIASDHQFGDIKNSKKWQKGKTWVLKIVWQTFRDASDNAITIGTGEMLIAAMFINAIIGDAQMATVTPK